MTTTTSTPLSPTRPAAVYWALWVAVTIAGLLAGTFMAIFVGFGLGDIVTNALGEFAGQVTVGLGFGLSLGLGIFGPQAVLLRSRTAGSFAYAWGGLLGAMAGFAVALPVSGQWGTEPSLLSAITIIALVALAAGIGQWLAGRGQLSPAWILVTAVSLAASMAVVLGLSGEGREVVTALSAGLVHGVISAAGAWWVLKGK
jgi:hypothetical protein